MARRKVNMVVYQSKFGEIMKFIIAGIVLLAMGSLAIGCSAMGTSPNTKRKAEYKKSNNYDGEKEVFKNRRAGLIEAMNKRNMNFKSIVNFFFTERKNDKPKESMPEIKPNLEEFLKPSKDLKSIWFGHSSFLLNMDRKIVLVDPVFSENAAPVSFAVKRFQAPVLKLEELPEVDYILISHDHYDHLDMDSIKFFKNKKAKFITPLGVGSHIEGWGIDKSRIVEKDWWQEAEFEGVKFIATPAQHFSGRGLFDRNCTQWASWVLQSENHNIYFSGDTGYDTHFKDIGEKYGPFDVAFIESGQYNKKWEEVHMLPEQAAQAYIDLKAKKYFPVHWGMFVLSVHTWFDPMEQLFRISKEKDINLVVPKIGQIVNFSEDFTNDLWWKTSMTFEEPIYQRKLVVNYED
jgi:L-ascorbate metabolism protein UlaG (beta-lactamase superfamily)